MSQSASIGYAIIATILRRAISEKAGRGGWMFNLYFIFFIKIKISSMNKAKPTQPAKTQPPAPAKAGFDPKSWAKNGVTEEEVTAAKTAFDLFDSDQGGSVDIKGNSCVI